MEDKDPFIMQSIIVADDLVTQGAWEPSQYKNVVLPV